MSDEGSSSEQRGGGDRLDFEHPRGTLVIVMLFAALFGLAWLAMYVFRFLERGALHP